MEMNASKGVKGDCAQASPGKVKRLECSRALREAKRGWNNAVHLERRQRSAYVKQLDVSNRICEAVTRRYGAKRPFLAFEKISNEEVKMSDARLRVELAKSIVLEQHVMSL